MIGTPRVSSPSTGFTRYTGVGFFDIVAINPTMKELNELGLPTKEEPKYTGTRVDSATNKEVAWFLVSVVLKPNNTKHPELTTPIKVNYFVSKQYRQGSQSGKYQIIDEFGRTAWATKEDIQEKKIPMYSNGPANISANYRPALQGEEELIAFIRGALNIASPYTKEGGVLAMKPKEELSECMSYFDNIDNLFKGNFNEITSSFLPTMPLICLKQLVYLRTNGDREYTEVLTGIAFSYEKAMIANKEATISEYEMGRVQSVVGGRNITLDFTPLHEVKYAEQTVKEEEVTVAPDDLPF